MLNRLRLDIMKKILGSLFLFIALNQLYAQEIVLPYDQIPEAPENFQGQNILSRMIDGLGFRYYWATKDLRPSDLLFTPGNDGRNCIETLDHILGLSRTILNAAKNEANGPSDWSEYSWEQKREMTLRNLKEASDLFRSIKSSQLKKQMIIFERDGKRSEYPLWNLINGPIADAINHVGQIVSFRRSAGNPVPIGVNVFKGTHTHQH